MAGGPAASVCLEWISPCFALFTIDLFGWLVGKKNLIIGKPNGGVAVTIGEHDRLGSSVISIWLTRTVWIGLAMAA